MLTAASASQRFTGIVTFLFHGEITAGAESDVVYYVPVNMTISRVVVTSLVAPSHENVFRVVVNDVETGSEIALDAGDTEGELVEDIALESGDELKITLESQDGTTTKPYQVRIDCYMEA